MKILKAGKVLLSDFVVVPCSICDISSDGARLEFQGPVCLPEAFRLRLVAADLEIPATVIWQRRLEAGIRFTDAGASRPAAPVAPAVRSALPPTA
jgi:hypothetical protein